LSLGFFATGQYGLAGATGPDHSVAIKGLFYGGGITQLKAQIIGSAIVTAATFGIALLLMYGVKALGVLRVSQEVEIGGLDIHEHGAPVYHPEPAYDGYSAIPSGAAVGMASVAAKPKDSLDGDLVGSP
jgi:Amt family ammonium transporter